MPHTFFKFFVGEEPLCMDIHDIHLVVPIEDFNTVPRTPPMIKGITEVGGKVVTLIDLNALFGTVPGASASFHAALLSDPFRHIAICLYSQFDVVEIQKGVSFETIKEKDPDYALGIKKRLNVLSAWHRYLEAGELIHSCEVRIRDYVRKNCLIMPTGEKNEESYPHRG